MGHLEHFSLQNKVALVTGSTNGIGRAIAYGLAEAGAKVWFHGRTIEAGEKLAKELNGRFARADFTKPEEIQMLVETIGNEEERLDILVNNAGMDHSMSLENMDMASFDKLWLVNTRAPVMLTHLLLPLLKKAQGASIINVTSIHQSVPYAHNAAYTMSKAALDMFTKTASIELAPLGIRMNNLAPGAILTDLNREIIKEVGDQNFREWIPLGRVGSTSEMVDPVIFLASDASSYVTGTTIYADGAYRHHLVRYRL